MTLRSVLCLLSLAVPALATTTVADLTISSLTFQPWNGASTRVLFDGSTAYPGFSADLHDDSTAEAIIRAPAGMQFSVHAPAGSSVGFAGAFYYSTPGWAPGPNDSFFSGVTVQFEGLTGDPVVFNPSPSGRVGGAATFARFNATTFTPIEATFAFTALKLTWTWPQIPTDAGVVNYSPLGGGSFDFFTGSNLSTPFLTLEALPASTVPEPATFAGGAVALALCAAGSLRARRKSQAVTSSN